MELMQRDSTEKRLDDLNAKVDRGFERIDADIRGLRTESRAEFAAVRAELKNESAALRAEMKVGFDAINERFERVDEKFESLHRLMVQFSGSLLGTVIVASAALIATQL
jgi:tetrahydromethanopterin S-methyltransferase subunit G